MPEEVVMVHIVATEDEMQEGLDRIEGNTKRIVRDVLLPTEQRTKEIARDAVRLEKQARIVTHTAASAVTMSFQALRSVFTVFGKSMGVIESAVLQTLETSIKAMLDIQLALTATAITPGYQALAIGGAVATIASSAMLTASLYSAREDFAEIGNRIAAGNTLMDLASRV